MRCLDELAIRNEFIKDIEAIFSESYDIIDGEVVVFSSNDQNATFPCCVVSVHNIVDNAKYDNSEGTNQYVDFDLNCEIYSNDLQKYNRHDAVIKLSQILINGLLTKYSTLTVTRNTNLPYANGDVDRRLVRFSCTYDVNDNIIYS